MPEGLCPKSALYFPSSSLALVKAAVRSVNNPTIARSDEQLARVNEQISKLEHDAARKKSANWYRRPSRGRPALRGFVGLLLTAGICIAAFASQSSGETA